MAFNKKFFIIIFLIFSIKNIFSLNLLKEKVLVVKVIDGDSLIVLLKNKKEKIRIWGIDTPESNKNRYGKIEYIGIEVKNWVKSLIEKKYIYIIYSCKNKIIKRDKYKRILAFIEYNNKDIGKELLLRGYAKVYKKEKSPREKIYLKYEQEAKKKKIGIWKK